MNLIIQPDAGIEPIMRAIRRAKHAVDLAVFRSDQHMIENALGTAVQRGIRVRVLVAHTNSGGEDALRKLEQRLLDIGATVTRTGDDFVRYHGKFMVIDDTLYILGFNFTKADTLKSRSFGVSTRDRTAVRDALALFEADSTRQPFAPRRTRLVVSPENAREMLVAFVKGARQQLLVYDVNVQDPVFAKLLKQRASAGVDVRVIGKFKDSSGVDVRPLRDLRLHARAIVRDGERVFVGSQSLRRAELDQRREVGVIVSNATVARALQHVFESDWAESGETAEKRNARPRPVALAVSTA